MTPHKLNNARRTRIRFSLHLSVLRVASRAQPHSSHTAISAPRTMSSESDRTSSGGTPIKQNSPLAGTSASPSSSREGLALMHSVSSPLIRNPGTRKPDGGAASPLTSSPSSRGFVRYESIRGGADILEEVVLENSIVEILKGGRQRLKAGTLEEMLTWVLSMKCDVVMSPSDQRVLRAFLIAYRIYFEPKELWDALIARFPFEKSEDAAQEETQEQQRTVLIQFVLSWLEECATEDFFSVEGKYAPPLWKSTQEFLKKLQIHKFNAFSTELVGKMKMEAQKEAEAELEKTSLYEDSGLMWSLTKGVASLYSYMAPAAARPELVEGQFGLLEILPEEVCTCLTIADFHQFRRIKLGEFLSRAWEKEPKTSKIAEIAQRFERIAFWVATEILSVENLYERKAVLDHFILIAEKCFLANNFNATMALLAGLNNGAVSRLKKTWAELPYRTKEIYDKLSEYMSPLSNFKGYREHLDKIRASNKPVFPYLALLLRDITFTHENPNKIEELWNFHKLDILGRQMLDVRHFQRTQFQLAEVSEVINSYFQNLKVITKEEDLYSMSNAVEKREPPSPSPAT